MKLLVGRVAGDWPSLVTGGGGGEFPPAGGGAHTGWGHSGYSELEHR